MTSQRFMGRGSMFYSLISSVFFVLLSCTGYVSVDPPISELSSNLVFDDAVTASAAVTALYGKMVDGGFANGDAWSITVSMGLSSDELTTDSSSPSIGYFINNNHLPSSPQVLAIWTDCYYLIYAANSVLEGINRSYKISQSLRDQLSGEALFVRAFCHFYLVNLFGDIPYVTSTDYRLNSTLSRTSERDVYNGIIADLDLSQSLLPGDYLTDSRTRPNKFTALALQSRVFLYSGDWTRAESSAGRVIESSLYRLVDIDSVFLRASRETIWQLAPKITGETNNTQEAYNFLPRNGGAPFYYLSDYMVGAFELNDKRGDRWVGQEEIESKTYSFPRKYKEFGFTDQPIEMSVVLRLAEQYLIRAEARAHNEYFVQAQEDIDKIRGRAGLTSITTDEEGIFSIIEKERFVELFAEWGHRWFDLKRTGRADVVFSPIKPGWDVRHLLLPIPQSEILVNTNLKPNPGY
jgi:hypothetical protein